MGEKGNGCERGGGQGRELLWVGAMGRSRYAWVKASDIDRR